MKSDAVPFDFQVTINQQLGNKILDTLHFPLQIHYDFQAPFPSFGIAEELDSEASDRDWIVDDVLAQPLRSRLDVDNKKFWHSEGSSAKPESSVCEENEISDQDETKTQRYDIEIHSIEIRLQDKPQISISNPISIHNLTLEVKTHFTASIVAFGKRYSTQRHTPWIRFQDCAASINLVADKSVLYASLELQDIDLLAKVKIFKWQYNCQLGITKIVNKQLKKRNSVQIMDFAHFQRALTPNATPLLIEAIELRKNQDSLCVQVRLQPQANAQRSKYTEME